MNSAVSTTETGIHSTTESSACSFREARLLGLDSSTQENSSVQEQHNRRDRDTALQLFTGALIQREIRVTYRRLSKQHHRYRVWLRTKQLSKK
ncbi:hypothetical protein JZ751_015036 [Albula glossodonta]|uniref:Uncharacterized protein n=1 Tax=Albula glossodonta TaxID=121402 RepID=A0A8T2MJC3_9TELE|nr:hypothetical protein JZ751_016171 [Albula glossodonta]KAG9328304.1 hypothetical protein JZ751_015036 [Albula glossodonta]